MATGELIPTAETTEQADVRRLHQMGYAQELRRRMSGFSNFAVSFTIISILSGCLTLYGFGMSTGGPVAMTIGWPIVGVLRHSGRPVDGRGLLELSHGGGLYYWAAKLAPQSDRTRPSWSWFCGWFNLLGQVAVTAGIDFGAALFITAFLNLTTGLSATPHWHVVAIYSGVLLLHGSELLRRAGGGAPVRRERVVAPHRRARHR